MKIVVIGDTLIVDTPAREKGFIVLAPVRGAVGGHLIGEDGSQGGLVHTLEIEIRSDRDPDLGDVKDHDHSPKLGKDHVHSAGAGRGHAQVLKMRSSHVPIARAGGQVQRMGVKECLVQDPRKSLEAQGDFSISVFTIMHSCILATFQEWNGRCRK